MNTDVVEVNQMDKQRADEVLAKIDEITRMTEQYANKSVAAMCKLLIEAKQGAYWVERGHRTEDDYIKTLPYSRAHYYNLIGIGLHLGFLPEETIAELGVKKAEALVRISKHSPALTDEWIKKAKSQNAGDFLHNVRAFFKKKDACNKEVTEWIRIKASKGQADIIKEAFRVAEKMLGSEKSQAHQLESICAEFLAGSNEDGSNRLEQRDGFLISIIRNLAKQLSGEAVDALIGALASLVEE